MTGADRILDAYSRGHPALLITGRSLYDFDIDPADGKLRSILEILRRQLFKSVGVHLATYSLAAGLQWSGAADSRDQAEVEQLLRRHGLLELTPGENEQVRTLRGIFSLARATTNVKWHDGRDARVGFLLEFAEHLVPSFANGGNSDPQTHSTEFANLLGNSLALRASGNLVMFHGREGLIDELVVSALHLVHLPQPNVEEKKAFVLTASKLYTSAQFEAGLNADAVSHLTINTPNRGLEHMLRESHRSGEPITARQLSQQKNRDVEQISEQTLAALDTTRANGLELRGRNIGIAKRLLDAWIDGLAKGDENTPLNVVLVGPPGTGKTVLALSAAAAAKVAAYQVLNPKGSLVGETERKVRLQWHALNEWGGVGFVDEVTEALPLQRSDFNGDSGATQAVTATLLTELSNEAVRGRRMLVGTTNCPWRIGAAMRSRLRFVPVTNPLMQDYPAIVAAIAASLSRTPVDFDETDSLVRLAAEIFYNRGANPRDIRDQLSDTVFFGPSGLRPEALITAAEDFAPSADTGSMVYADLWAVRVCSRKSYLPWAADPGSYEFPPHLENLVDPKTGEVNIEKIDRSIESMKGHANV
jgi:hypothetical protein